MLPEVNIAARNEFAMTRGALMLVLVQRKRNWEHLKPSKLQVKKVAFSKQDQAKPSKTTDTTQFVRQALPRVHRKDLEFKTCKSR